MVTTPSSIVLDPAPQLDHSRPAGLTRPGGSFDAVRHAFGVEFSVFDPAADVWLHQSSAQPGCRSSLHEELCREVARRKQPEVIAEEEPLLIMAIPLTNEQGMTAVAVGVFVTREVPSEQLRAAAERLELRSADIAAWGRRQPIWPADAVLRMCDLLRSNWDAVARAERLEQDVNKLSVQLGSTYEEICLLFRLTQNLKISRGVEDLARLTLNWLAEAIAVKGLAILLHMPEQEGTPDNRRHLLTAGDCDLNKEQFIALVDALGSSALSRPLVVNPPITDAASWRFPQVRQLVLVPLTEGERVFGWLALVNHRDEFEFGTVEASLLSSVAAILGIHSGNIDLYRQQAEFLAGVVRALTSAIDAKDPYTCGHSDRVARVAVRIAEELGCDEEQLRSIYMSGLLHDVGKIGIDDNVLRKPGKLTDAEFEHIKTHAEIGYRILRDLKQIEHVLPVVRHHHESWDGTGYPAGLAGANIPLMARIVAVADSFDAMSSDRPYRPGMPDEKLDQIIRSGSGKQWDATIVEAFFRARDDIRAIAHRDREPHDELSVTQWA